MPCVTNYLVDLVFKIIVRISLVSFFWKNINFYAHSQLVLTLVVRFEFDDFIKRMYVRFYISVFLIIIVQSLGQVFSSTKANKL